MRCLRQLREHYQLINLCGCKLKQAVKEERNQIKLTTACHRIVVGNLLHLFFAFLHKFSSIR